MALDDEQRRRELGDRLRELRAGRPQRVLSDRLGVTERTYGAWERGEQGIQWDHLEDVAAYHQVSTSYLLYGSETRPEQAGPQLDRIEARLDEIHALLTGESADSPGVVSAAGAPLLERVESRKWKARARPQSARAKKRRSSA